MSRGWAVAVGRAHVTGSDRAAGRGTRRRQLLAAAAGRQAARLDPTAHSDRAAATPNADLQGTTGQYAAVGFDTEPSARRHVAGPIQCEFEVPFPWRAARSLARAAELMRARAQARFSPSRHSSSRRSGNGAYDG